MADPKNPGGEDTPKQGWKKITKVFKVRGGASRKKAAVTVRQSGSSVCNVESSEIVFESATARGIDPTKEFWIDMAADDEREMIAVWATDEATPGTSTINRYQKGSTSWISFHLGAAFLQHPNLRPDVLKVECQVKRELDEKGLPIMTIPIKAGKAKISQSRDDDDTTPGSQAAASEES